MGYWFNLVVLFVVISMVTWCLTFVMLRIGVRQGIVDVPNARSSHSVPVPRCGGVSIILVFLVFLLVYSIYFDRFFDGSALKSLIIGATVISIIGWVDDLGHVSAKWRFFAHLGAAIYSLSILSATPSFLILGIDDNFGIFGLAFLAISLVWFVNMFNFMDGIDGIAGIETITVLVSASLILFVQGDITWMPIFGVLVFSTTGFLIWNWPPAKIFMGDAGSGFLGFVLGLFAVITSLESTINLWTWLILCGVFLVDATTTLITRIVSGEKWYDAHRSHAYQILARRFESHRRVTMGVAAVNLVWLLPFAYLSAVYPFWALPICVGALLPLLVTVIRVRAGRAETMKSGS